jgi:hypothetical protein
LAWPIEAGDKTELDRVKATDETTGIVVVAACAEKLPAPPAIITATSWRTKSAASEGIRSY